MKKSSKRINGILGKATSASSQNGSKISSSEGGQILRAILNDGKFTKLEYNSLSKLRKGKPADIDISEVKKAINKISSKGLIKKKDHDDLVLLLARCEFDAFQLLCKRIVQVKNNSLECPAPKSIEKHVVSTLVRGAPHINFHSPSDPSIRYFSNDYYDVSRMIGFWGLVEVWEFYDRRANGSYRSSSDMLFYARTDSRGKLQRQSTILHEATHVIQDWAGYDTNPVRTRVDYETDAHIAQTIFLLQENGKLYGRLHECEDAAKVVLSGKELTVASDAYLRARAEVDKAYGSKEGLGTKFSKDKGSWFEELYWALPSLGKTS